MTFRRGQRPDPKDDAANLTDDDVERRLGGDAGLGGPVPDRPAPPPVPAPADSPTMTFRGDGGGGRRRGGVLWRDVGLVLVLLVFLAVGARVVLPDSSTAVASPSPGASTVAVASPTPRPATPSPTPLVSPSPTPGTLPSEVVPSQPEPTSTVAPTPTPTGAPHVTPAPTPHPTPTATPPTATVTVSFLIINDGTGGNDGPSSWTVHVTGAGASPSSYNGVSSRSVQVNAGQAYSVTTTASTPGGYVQELTDECSGTLTANQTGQCTIKETAIEPKLQVFVSGLPNAGDTTVTVSGANASVPSFPGSASGTSIRVYANATYTISASAVSGYSQSSVYGSCSGPLREGASVQCILYFTASAAALPSGETTAAILRASPL